jgi:DNA helicase-2/ATP-dependent DNA helicase PcrA
VWQIQQRSVSGGDAQSIYSFRGSTIANILNFESDYPDSLVIKLEQNYRSTKNILAVAESVISLNSEQKPKKLWTENHEGSKIIVRECDNERDEAAFVARTIVKKVSGESDLEEDFEDEPEPVQTFSILDQFLNKQKRQSGGRSFLGLPQLPSKHEPLSDFAVLYRTHAQSRALEEALIEAAIPYQIIGGVKFYERKEIKDMLAYLRLIQNFRDLVSLKRVINIPTRGIGDKSYQIIKQFMQPFFEQSKDAQDNNIELSKFRQEFPKISLPPKQMESAKQFFGLLESFTVLEKIEPLSGLMRLVYKKVGMDTWLDDGTDSGEARLENVQELFNVSAKYDHLPWQDGLEQFLEEVALVAEIDSMQDTKDVVTLMTLHSAKGLEFDNVFFVGLEEGILPHSRTLLSPVELAEEIRLAYVGITRARKQLYLLYARQRSLFGNTQPARPSRILQALPTHNLSSNNASFNLNDGEVSYEAMDF